MGHPQPRFAVILSGAKNLSYSFCLSLCAFVLVFVLVGAAPARATIRYDVSLAHPERHQFHVTMTVPVTSPWTFVQMPAWDALYQIRDFGARVTDFRASDAAGNSLPVRRLDKGTWQIDTYSRGSAISGLRIQYTTFWDEPGPFDTQLNSDHAFINLAMILCYVPERRGEDDVVHFTDVPRDWRTAVELPPDKAEPGGAAPGALAAPNFIAPNYDALVDAPVEIGQFEEWSFTGGTQGAGRTIRVVYHGERVDHDALTRMLAQIVNYETTMMGGAPFPEYTFFLHVGPNYGGGGMEHANCTAISVDSFGQLADVSAHEFFHLWNVKRIRPQTLEPVDHTREMYTRALWFAEGVTSTYAAYTLVRTGLWSHAQFLADLGKQINELESRPARAWQSAEESSLDTWLDKYSLYNRPEFSISYYNKGQLLGVALDILIRDATDDRASLDDVMRRMNREYAELGRYYDDSAGVERAVEETVSVANTSSAPGVEPFSAPNLGAGAESTGSRAVSPFADFFRRYVSGTDEMPFADLLARAGLTLGMLSQSQASKVQGVPQVYYVQDVLDPTPRQLRIRNGILQGTTDHIAAVPAAVGKSPGR
jgi:predicted metalloprotease with PDZ domain